MDLAAQIRISTHHCCF